MSDVQGPRLRTAGPADAARLVALWGQLYDEMGAGSDTWRDAARDWVVRCAGDDALLRIPVIEDAGELVASAVGTVEVGVPNPHSPTGRGVRLANVFTLPDRRGRGYATRLIGDVIAWAERLDVDRVDLSATPDGQRTYERLGFTLTSAPRMKKMLHVDRFVVADVDPGPARPSSQ
jgi:GNAT superfamily N-acetyltransferase